MRKCKGGGIEYEEHRLQAAQIRSQNSLLLNNKSKKNQQKKRQKQILNSFEENKGWKKVQKVCKNDALLFPPSSYIRCSL